MIPQFTARCILAFAFLASSVLAPSHGAQPHPGRVLVGGGNPTGSTYLHGLFGVDRTSQALTTVIDTAPAPRPNQFDQLAMDVDNRNIVFGTRYVSRASIDKFAGVFRYDPQSMQYTTIAHSTLLFRRIAGLTLDQDGAWLAVSESRDLMNQTGYGVYRIEERPLTTVITTVMTTLQLGQAQRFVDDALRDVTTGDLLIPAAMPMGSAVRPVLSLAHDGTVSTFHASTNGPNPSWGMVQEIRTGDLLNMSGSQFYRTEKGTMPRTTKTVAGLAPLRVLTMVFENQSTPNPTLIGYGYLPSTTQTRASLVRIDPLSATVVKIDDVLTANTLVPFPDPLKEAINEGSRYVQTEKTGTRQWRIHLNFPTFPRKGYVLAAGTSGIRPGVPVSGRRVWLNFDALTSLTVTNAIPAAFNPGPLVLDPTGAATGRIDARFLPGSTSLRMHIVAAVLDPAAPGGIAFVTEPYPMTL